MANAVHRTGLVKRDVFSREHGDFPIGFENDPVCIADIGQALGAQSRLHFAPRDARGQHSLFEKVSLVNEKGRTRLYDLRRAVGTRGDECQAVLQNRYCSDRSKSCRIGDVFKKYAGSGKTSYGDVDNPIEIVELRGGTLSQQSHDQNDQYIEQNDGYNAIQDAIPAAEPVRIVHVSILSRRVLRLGETAVHLRYQFIGQQAGEHILNLVHEAADLLGFAFQQGIVAVSGYLGRISLVLHLPGLSILHAGPIEEMRVGDARHKAGDDDIGRLQFVGEPHAEIVHEGLSRIIDQLICAGHIAGDRACDEYPPFVAQRHVSADLVDERDGAFDVGIDDVRDIFPFLREERIAKAVPGIGNQRIYRALPDRFDELFDTVPRAEIGFERLDLRGPIAFAALSASDRSRSATSSSATPSFAASLVSSRPMPLDAPVMTQKPVSLSIAFLFMRSAPVPRRA